MHRSTFALRTGHWSCRGKPDLGAAATLQGLPVVGVPHTMAVMVTTVGAESPYYFISYTIYRS
jgi:hypothetical protein